MTKRSKNSQFRRRGQQVRFEKKPNAIFFKMQMPHDRDKLIKESNAYRQAHENHLSKLEIHHSNKHPEDEILAKEKQPKSISKKTRKKNK